MTPLRLLVTLVLLCAPFVLYVAATARSKRDNGLWLIFPVIMAIPSGLGGLFVLAPLEAILDARGGGHLKNVILPIAGGALVFVVLGIAWIRGRRRRAEMAARRNVPVRPAGRQQLWVFVLWCAVGVVWGALWRVSEPIARVILTGHR